MFGIGWSVRDGYGWGVFGLNLILESLRDGRYEPVALAGLDGAHLSTEELSTLQAWVRRRVRPEPGRLPYPVLHALGNGLQGGHPQFVGDPEVGVIFFEDTNLDTPSAQAALKRFDAFLAGSRWNAECLRAAGAASVFETPQGVDQSRFHPRPRTGRWTGRFVVFSGGKLEPRKGQDLSLAAFRRFHARHPEALLVTAWHSPWPALADALAASPHVSSAPPRAGAELDLDRWLLQEGLPEDSFVNLGSIPNRAFPELLAECDAALLPSRAEGGTNLVAMECLAMGLPTVLSANTGHLDLIATVPCVALQAQGPVAGDIGTEGWGESDVDEMVAALEALHADPGSAAALGRGAAEAMDQWSWPKRVPLLLDALDDVHARKDAAGFRPAPAVRRSETRTVRAETREGDG